MNILVVDDDTTTLQLLERNITKWGYHVATAENGQVAIEHVEKSSVDLIVSDWLMPEMEGLETIQKIKTA